MHIQKQMCYLTAKCQITHILYSALSSMPTEEENVRVNLAMLQNVVRVVEHVCCYLLFQVNIGILFIKIRRELAIYDI